MNGIDVEAGVIPVLTPQGIAGIADDKVGAAHRGRSNPDIVIIIALRV